MKLRLLVLLFAASVMACGGDSSSPSAPSVSTSSIAVSVASPVKIGATAQATGSASLSNGTSQPVTTGWKSDSLNVATVTDAGLVTGVANGNATIYVVSGGRQGQQVIRVLPDYQGSWAVVYRITACSQTGTFASVDFCAGEVGSSGRATMALNQSGEALTGQFTLRLFGGEVPFGSLNGPIGADGGTAFTSNGNASGFAIASSWNVNQTTRNVWSGTTREVWTYPGASGQAVFDGTITSTSRTAAVTAPTPGRVLGLSAGPGPRRIH